MNTQVTLYQSILRISKKYPNEKAMYYNNRSFTYSELISEIDKCAQGLYDFGFRENDVITICMPNIPECIFSFYAISKIGGIAHMVHPLTSANQLLDNMKQAESKMLITLDINYNKYSTLQTYYPIVLVSPTRTLNKIKQIVFNFINRKNLNFSYNENVISYKNFIKKPKQIPINNDSKKTAIYLHSGGTSGRAKTIMLSSFALNSLVINGHEILSIGEPIGKSMFAVLPMFHGFGLCMGVHAMLYHGGIITIMPKFHTKSTIKLIKQGKINYIIGIPMLYEALLKNKHFNGKYLQNLSMAFVGGDFVSQNLLDRFNSHMKKNYSNCRLYEGYGLTETVTVCAVNNNKYNKRGTVGKLLSNVGAYVLNPDDKGYGELCICGDVLMNGYLHDEEETRKSFIDIKGVKYVKTGDICKVDDEGFVYFKSRIKRICKVNGVNVYPSEIEHLLSRELGINELVAVDIPDKERGSGIVIFVKGEEDNNLREKINIIIKDKLSIYSLPKEIKFIPFLPKTNVGKVDINKIREKYL